MCVPRTPKQRSSQRHCPTESSGFPVTGNVIKAHFPASRPGCQSEPVCSLCSTKARLSPACCCVCLCVLQPRVRRCLHLGSATFLNASKEMGAGAGANIYRWRALAASSGWSLHACFANHLRQPQKQARPVITARDARQELSVTSGHAKCSDVCQGKRLSRGICSSVLGCGSVI